MNRSPSHHLGDPLDAGTVTQQRPAIRLQHVGLWLMAALIFFEAGCGSKDASQERRKPVFPVQGQVLFAGRPTPYALVVFHPLNPDDKDTPRPRGQVGADGKFTLTTYEPGDGAPAGDYRVTVELWLSSGKRDEGPSNRLPARYGDPTTSGLTARVNTGPTELQPFHLKR